MRREGLLAACVLAAMLGWPGAAAPQLRALTYYDGAALFQEYRNGVVNALPPGTIRVPAIGAPDLIERLQSEDWDFVLVVRYLPLSREQHEALAEGLERHISRGGTLLFTYTHLDEAPELCETLGVASAEDPVEPEAIVWTEPFPPAWLGTSRLGITAPPLWGDFGDVLTPAPGGRVIGVYEGSGAPVMLDTRDGYVLLNGLNWDDWQPAGLFGHSQTKYLITCIPDFDDNGILDFFDFLAFQNAFAAKDPRADLNRSGTWDIFDFLGFQDAFTYGCRPSR